MATLGCAQIGGSSQRRRSDPAPVAGAREACRTQINSAVCVLTKPTMLEMHLEAILPAHSRFSRSWQLEHVRGRDTAARSDFLNLDSFCGEGRRKKINAQPGKVREGGRGACRLGFSLRFGWEPIPFQQVASSSGKGEWLPMGSLTPNSKLWGLSVRDIRC